MGKAKKDGKFIDLVKSFVTSDAVSRTALSLASAIITDKLNKSSEPKTSERGKKAAVSLMNAIVQSQLNKPNDESNKPVTSSGKPPNIVKYLALHEQVLAFIDENKKKDAYKPHPITKTIDISCTTEAVKILSEPDLEHYIKYYTWFHGGSGKSTGRYDPNDRFVAIPRK